MKQAILIFARNPIYGKVKTRLSATVGNDVALDVYRKLLKHTVAITSNLRVEKTVFYSNFVEENDIWKDSVYQKQVQAGNDLGERMENSFSYAFQQEKQKIVIIGTDCPELTPGIIMDAFAYLKAYDVVLGPATDGGYYLLAMKEMHPPLFQNISWSTDEVLKQTLEVCHGLKLSVYLLPELSDLDNENDLNRHLMRI